MQNRDSVWILEREFEIGLHSAKNQARAFRCDYISPLPPMRRVYERSNFIHPLYTSSLSIAIVNDIVDVPLSMQSASPSNIPNSMQCGSILPCYPALPIRLAS